MKGPTSFSLKLRRQPLPPRYDMSVILPNETMNADDLSMLRFAAVESSDFTIAALSPDGAVAIEVTARLQSLTPRATTPDYEQYAMCFIGPVQPLLPQGTYRFGHATLGELLLFMVPVGQDAQGTQYEVCVTRKLK